MERGWGWEERGGDTLPFGAVGADSGSEGVGGEESVSEGSV